MNVKKLVTASIIAAVYAALTLALPMFSYGPVQIRFSEALTLLPLLMVEAIPGLFVGCLLANIGGAMMGVTTVMDIVVGSLCTLAAACLTYRCKKLWTGAIPPVVINAVVLGLMFAVLQTPNAVMVSFPLFAAEVAIGQAVACFGCGIPLMIILKRINLQTHRPIN